MNVSWFSKLKAGLKKSAGSLEEMLQNAFSSEKIKGSYLSAENIEKIQEGLVCADLGWEFSEKICKGFKGKKFEKMEDVLEAIAFELETKLSEYSEPFSALGGEEVQVILVVGVNGSGKTTTIAKLTNRLLREGKSVEWAACDTFRAAALEQMQIWAARLGVHVYKAANAEGKTEKKVGDPASVAFTALQKAIEKRTNVLFIDTAGRLQNNLSLMEELAKITRVIKKLKSSAPEKVLLVIDGTTGQNALSQIELFSKIVPVSGIVVTKLDGTAKAGFIINVCEKSGVKVVAVGVGEGMDDLDDLEPKVFARSLVGLKNV